jgi:hypothetical protein
MHVCEILKSAQKVEVKDSQIDLGNALEEVRMLALPTPPHQELFSGTSRMSVSQHLLQLGPAT